MINFKQYLTEARSAPLYHATSPHMAYLIISENKFKANASHTMDDKRHKRPGPWGTPKTFGVSFSRSKQAAINFGFHDKALPTVVIFEIDQQKLIQRHKTVPVSYIGKGEAGDRNMNVARTPRDRHYDPAEGWFYANEYEEFVLGDIKNVEPMIIKIHVMSPLTEEIIMEQYPLLWEHPKLYNSTNKLLKGNFYNNKKGA